MWEPRTETTPYHILSPIINIPDGPSGITHYPGTGLPTQFDGMFFVCGFKGSSARSSISMLKVKQDGADFTIEHEPAVFIGDVQATDVDFGPDSRVYFSEWGEGWEGTGRGRIYKLEHTAAQQEQAAQIAEVKKLLGEGFKQRPVAELARLIGHKDQRIRLRAQWALASLPGGAEAFLTVAMKGTDRIARLHGMWGFAQAARLAGHKDAASAPAALQPLVALLADTDAEIRAQAAHVIGDTLGSIFGDKAPQQVAPLVGALLPLLRDQEPRVQFFAAQSLAKLRDAAHEPGQRSERAACRRHGAREDRRYHRTHRCCSRYRPERAARCAARARETGSPGGRAVSCGQRPTAREGSRALDQ
jgi:quinoprotein glucose dehydrogenase